MTSANLQRAQAMAEAWDEDAPIHHRRAENAA
jgi:hypothetical protein